VIRAWAPLMSFLGGVPLLQLAAPRARWLRGAQGVAAPPQGNEERQGLLPLGGRQGLHRAEVRRSLQVAGSVVLRQGQQARTTPRTLPDAPVSCCVPARLLPHADPGIQELALECVLLWRERGLLPYAARLQRLVDFKTLQEELTVWDASPQGGQVAAEHRASLLPVLLRLLLPKLMRRRGSLSGKVRRPPPGPALHATRQCPGATLVLVLGQDTQGCWHGQGCCLCCLHD